VLPGKYRSGTSYAVPFVVAIAATCLMKNPSLSRDILFRAIKNSVTELGEQGHDAIYGWGLVQATDFNCKN
jgi:subtilisin family serine protease